MEYFWYRGEKCKECDTPVPVFGLGHYLLLKEGEDEFSKKVMGFYLHGYQFNYFLNRLVEFYDTRIKNDVHFDLVCVCPSHEKGKTNENMIKLAIEFSKRTGIPYKQVLRRVKDTKSQHELTKKEEREVNVKDSFGVLEDLTGKSVIVLDNTSISGATAKEIHNVMKKKNAKSFILICLGLGPLARHQDFDINPAFKGKISFIISNWNWPKVSKEKRAEFKSKKT